jgi:hypothetical protein
MIRWWLIRKWAVLTTSGPAWKIVGPKHPNSDRIFRPSKVASAK